MEILSFLSVSQWQSTSTAKKHPDLHTIKCHFMQLGFMPRKYALGIFLRRDYNICWFTFACLSMAEKNLGQNFLPGWARFFSGMGKTFFQVGQDFFLTWAKFSHHAPISLRQHLCRFTLILYSNTWWRAEEARDDNPTHFF